MDTHEVKTAVHGSPQQRLLKRKNYVGTCRRQWVRPRLQQLVGIMPTAHIRCDL